MLNVHLAPRADMYQGGGEFTDFCVGRSGISVAEVRAVD